MDVKIHIHCIMYDSYEFSYVGQAKEDSGLDALRFTGGRYYTIFKPYCW